MTASAMTAISSSVNSVWTLVVCFLIFFMQPGFALLEAGQVRAKNAANVVMKNMWDWSAGVLVWFLIGAAVYAIAGMIGTPGTALDLGGAFAHIGDPTSWIGWFFGAVFAMTAATIVSGAVAGRIKFSAYILYAVAITAVIYPAVAGSAWGGSGLLSSAGYLGQALGVGYKDFAGATVVHAVGGIAGLTAAYMVGPRTGRFDDSGNSRPIPGHNIIYAVLGTLILAFGWYGFNVGTQATVLTGDGVFQGAAVGRVLLNTTIAMGAGMVASTATNYFRKGEADPLFGANGLLAGLVAITGACAHVTWWGGLAIGIIGGIQTPLVYEWVVDSLNIDDVCGVFAVHGSAGFIGTMLIPFFDVAGFSVNQLIMQVAGSLIIGTWTVLATMGAMIVISSITGGLRVSEEEEEEGLDLSEHGTSAFPEFGGDRVATDGAGNAPKDIETDGGVDEPEVRTDGGKEIRTDGGDPDLKMIMSIIRPEKLGDVKKALAEVGAPSLTVTNVSGRGSQPAKKGSWRGEEYTVDLHQKVKIECIVADVSADETAEAIEEAANTGEPGDGKIFVFDVEDATQIRTGKEGTDAV